MLDQATRRLHDILENGTSMICSDCGCKFVDTDQNMSQQKFGQCPSCGSENIYIPTSSGDKWVYGELEEAQELADRRHNASDDTIG